MVPRRKWAGLLLLIFFLPACASSPPPAPAAAEAPPPAAPSPAPTSTATPAPAPPTGATSSDLSQAPPPPPPDLPPEEGAVDAGEGWTTPSPGGAAPTSGSSMSGTTPGYRVQVFASSEEKRAREVAAAARSRFGEPVYVEYETPLYKVRIGDCITRTEADALKDRAIAQGYDGPWVVESLVQVR